MAGIKNETKRKPTEDERLEVEMLVGQGIHGLRGDSLHDVLDEPFRRTVLYEVRLGRLRKLFQQRHFQTLKDEIDKKDLLDELERLAKTLVSIQKSQDPDPATNPISVQVEALLKVIENQSKEVVEFLDASEAALGQCVTLVDRTAEERKEELKLLADLCDAKAEVFVLKHPQHYYKKRAKYLNLLKDNPGRAMYMAKSPKREIASSWYTAYPPSVDFGSGESERRSSLKRKVDELETENRDQREVSRPRMNSQPAQPPIQPPVQPPVQPPAPTLVLANQTSAEPGDEVTVEPPDDEVMVEPPDVDVPKGKRYTEYVSEGEDTETKQARKKARKGEGQKYQPLPQPKKLKVHQRPATANWKLHYEYVMHLIEIANRHDYFNIVTDPEHKDYAAAAQAVVDIAARVRVLEPVARAVLRRRSWKAKLGFDALEITKSAAQVLVDISLAIERIRQFGWRCNPDYYCFADEEV
jgi:hypothetical protein